MSKKDLRVNDYLDHILQAIERIERYTLGKDEAAFLQDEQLQDAVIRNIEILGEAANNVKKGRSGADRQSPRSTVAGDGGHAQPRLACLFFCRP
jgi:uncharacterized protein with HEPN domain